MKKASLIIAFIVAAISCFSQTLFFDIHTKATWVATVKSKDSTIKNAKEIWLSKLSIPKNSLKSNATFWNFKDGLLTITNYDYQLKTETPVTTYNYQTNIDKGILSIALPDTLQQFDVGINSSGSFALLMKMKQKGRKK